MKIWLALRFGDDVEPRLPGVTMETSVSGASPPPRWDLGIALAFRGSRRDVLAEDSDLEVERWGLSLCACGQVRAKNTTIWPTLVFLLYCDEYH